MTANITGDAQKYEAPQIRILQGLTPDIVAIQEFNYLTSTPAEIRSFVDTAFGTNFAYYRESEAGYSIPNGIVSRWPILSSGSWDDPVLSNRGFAWAQIDLPGTNDLYLVSVHLYASGSATDRNDEATVIKNQVQSNFPPNAWVIVAGDMNTSTRTEAAINTFTTFLSDSPVPTDTESGGDDDTNLNRSKPYDYVLPSFSMTNTLTNVVFASHSFPNGLVFDSRVYSPLTDVVPVQSNDSGQCQHMAGLKDFYVDVGSTNSMPAAPEITKQPASVSVTEGGNANFFVIASGDAPLAYQWRFEGSPLPVETNTTYTRFNARPADAGNYTVVVTNNAGSVTSEVAMLTVNAPNTGTTNVIAQWDFNRSALDPSIGSGTASTVGGVSQTFFSGSGSTDPATLENSALGTADYPTQGTGNKTAGVRFNVSTVGREDISISWDTRASNTGSKYGRLQIATNGITFVDYATSVALAGGGTFYSFTSDLKGLPNVEDNPSFAIRIVSEFENTATGSGTAGYVAANPTSSYGTAGTLRFDMVTVYGSDIVIPPYLPPALREPTYTNGQFQFQLTGEAGTEYVIQTSTNLTETNWIPVWTNISPFLYVETNVASSPVQFYRGQPQP